MVSKGSNWKEPTTIHIISCPARKLLKDPPSHYCKVGGTNYTVKWIGNLYLLQDVDSWNKRMLCTKRWAQPVWSINFPLVACISFVIITNGMMLCTHEHVQTNAALENWSSVINLSSSNNTTLHPCALARYSWSSHDKCHALTDIYKYTNILLN